MSEQTINCPQCGMEIKLTESLAAPLVATVRSEYEKKLREQTKSVAAEREALSQREASLQVAKSEVQKQVDQQVEAKLALEKQALVKSEAARARQEVQDELIKQASDLADRDERLSELNAKLTVAQAAQAALLKKERELDDAKREFDLKLEQGIAARIAETRASALQEAQESLDLKIKERDTRIDQLKTQIDQLQRKAEQGSQQAQGEVLEMALEQQLRAQFPFDVIEPVGKGESGADIMHLVRDQAGQPCGKILWEFKRTKNWAEAWLTKLRADQRTAGADTAVIVSQSLPKGISHFSQIDGIWISSLACILPVAFALRLGLIDLANVRRASEGQDTKVQHVYEYLTGPRFQHRIEAIVENFTDMHEDLEKERKLMTKQWAKREQQIRAVIDTTSGLYGDLQGIAGRSLKEIDALEKQMLLADET
jgi:hypothetical protein